VRRPRERVTPVALDAMPEPLVLGYLLNRRRVAAAG
jgi:hypothetical protein